MAVWLRKLEEEHQHSLKVIWKGFSLDQVNQKIGPHFMVWEDDNYPARGWKALEAAKCAASQGDKVFYDYHYALFQARHDDKLDIAQNEVLIKVAEKVGLDFNRFRRDLINRVGKEEAAREHLEAVEKFGVFGTPTLVFEGKEAAYLKLAEIPSDKEGQLQLLELLEEVVDKRPFIQEIKRPLT